MKKIIFIAAWVLLSTDFCNAQLYSSGNNSITGNNVGVGNNTPIAKLAVNGNALFSNISTPPTSSAFIRGNSVYSTALTPEYTWWNNDQTGLFHPNVNIIGFTTGGTEKMRIAANGNIGIGTIIPAEKLHVAGNIKLGNAGGQNNVGIEWYTSPWGNGFGHKIYNTDPGGQTDLRIAARHNTGTWTDMVTFTSTGNIGIGTTTPTQKLHVNNGLIMISGGSPFGGAMIVFSDNIAAGAYPNGRWGIEYEPTAKGLNFWQPWNPVTGGGGNYYMFLNNDGKIGMGIDPGTTNAFPAGYRLYVKDGIITEKIKVAIAGSANWSDYVFADDYKLRSLQEVEAFVKARKHLPGMLSAEQMVKEGNDLGATDAKLLEKIEELTLYMIELNKRVIKLEAENTILKSFVPNFKQ